MHIFSSWVIEDSLGEAQCEQMAAVAGASTCWVVKGAWEPALLAMFASVGMLTHAYITGMGPIVLLDAGAGGIVF